MSKIEGIKSVDFKIEASGHGVVNWNGPIKLNSINRILENHSVPKLRGFANKIEKENKEGKSENKYMFIEEIDLKKTPLYISQNCIRHHLFREQAYDLHFIEGKTDKKNKNNDVNNEHMIKLLSSITGLVRGFVLPTKSQFKRTSALLITDFIDQLGNGNFEQFTRSGRKESQKDKSDNSIFSKTTFGETKYTAHGSISIEQLQFISLDNKFDRAAFDITDREIDQDQLVERIQSFIKSLDSTKEPKVTFHENYVRKGTIFPEGEAGLLLDDVACNILVQETLNRLNNLTIKQAKGYMMVDKIEVDYNDSNRMLRIKENSSEVSPVKNGNYAVYFEGV